MEEKKRIQLVMPKIKTQTEVLISIYNMIPYSFILYPKRKRLTIF